MNTIGSRRFRTPSHDPSANRQRGQARLGAIALSLTLGLLLLTPVTTPAGMFSKDAKAEQPHEKARKLPQQDFLPPIATINPTIEPNAANGSETEVEAVTLSAVTSPVIHTTPKVNRLDGTLNEQFRSAQITTVLEIQKKIDEADLEYLWRATVEKNPVIRFSLEKLTAPVDLQPKQSSKFLTKTLSTLISGATLAATMMPGGGQYRNMGSMAMNNALQNVINGKQQATAGSLSPTEQIQMAGLIDDLKMKLIQSYQNYKNTLQMLAESHQTTLKNNNLYSKALAAKNDLAIMAAGTAYYQALMNETSLRQKAKLERLALERLAGREAVSALELTIRPDDLQAAVNTTEPLGSGTSKASAGPPAPTDQQIPAARLNSPSEQSGNMPIDLPQPMEISPHLSSEGSPPEPITPITAIQLIQTSTTSSSPVKNESIPTPLPEILRHD